MDRVQREISNTDEMIMKNEKKVNQLSQEENIKSNKVKQHYVNFGEYSFHFNKNTGIS